MVEEHDSNARFVTGSKNMAVSRMGNENMQFNPYLWPNLRNACVEREIGIGKHDDDVVIHHDINLTVVTVFCC